MTMTPPPQPDMDGDRMEGQDNNKYVQFLRSNRNIILHGAPGTGKTYLARKIAEQMGCSEDEIGFVQFHPSYDYTDFVEGLRPIDSDGNVVFERKDGNFKNFCKKAVMELESQEKSPSKLSLNQAYEDILKEINEGEINSFWQRRGSGIRVKKVSPAGNIILCRPESVCDYTVSFNRLYKLYQKYPSISSLEKIKNLDREMREVIGGCDSSGYYAVLHKILEKMNAAKPDKSGVKKVFVFIIDEINRGELSKIFGELFFSIDPGYRGPDGTVKTQYQGLVYDSDIFSDGFFVPENVYIIGTMNDIDRSVESMDFAMRRRFAFMEVKADDQIAMLNGKSWKDEAIKRMRSLNQAIENVDGLSTAYHVGPAYFLKLDNYDGDFVKLWDYHIKGLLTEYFRGMPDAANLMEKMEEAYNLRGE